MWFFNMTDHQHSVVSAWRTNTETAKVTIVLFIVHFLCKLPDDCRCIRKCHLPATLLGTPLPGWSFFVALDMTAADSYCRFIGCTSTMRLSWSITSRRCSSGLRSGDCGTNVMDMVSNQFSCRLWRLNDAQLVLRDLKGAMKYLSTSLHHHYQPELSIKARMDPYFDFVYAKFCPYHSNVSA